MHQSTGSRISLRKYGNSHSLHPVASQYAARAGRRVLLAASVPAGASGDVEKSMEPNTAVREWEEPPGGWPDATLDVAKLDMANSLGDNPFFNRQREYNMLQEFLEAEAQKPGSVLVLLGPINSGKSALLKQIVEAEQGRTVYVNGGMKDIKSPKALSSALIEQLNTLSPIIAWKTLCVMFGSLPEVASAINMFLNKKQEFGKLLGGEPEDEAGAAQGVADAAQSAFQGMTEAFAKKNATELGAVLSTYNLILQTIEAGKKKPIVIIDEANTLKAWRTYNTQELQTFLEFLKRICKEEHRAHVVLGSSDSFLDSWLEQRGFDTTVTEVQVLGDLTPEEALKYVCGGYIGDLQGNTTFWPGIINFSAKSQKLGMTSEEWERVFSVCGGNIQLLDRCMKLASVYKSWNGAVEEMLDRARERVRSSLKRTETMPAPPGANPKVWTPAHYCAVLRLLIASEHHAVPRELVYAELEKVSLPDDAPVRQILSSMVEYNLLTLRKKSTMSSDILVSAFRATINGRDIDDDVVVTMTSPDLFAGAVKIHDEIEMLYGESVKCCEKLKKC